MNILITGAAGTVGMETIKKILEFDKNISITAFELPTAKKRLKVLENQINIQYGDLTNYADIERVCMNVDAVIHLAAIIPPLADDKPELAQKVNIGGTKNIIKALVKHSPSAILIYSSSVSVYGDRLATPNIFVTDELTPSDRDEYAKTKIEAEKLIQNSGLKWSIFRLSAIFGTDNHKIGKIMFHMPLETPIEFTTPADTGRAFANSIFNQEKIKGRIFNLGGGKNCRISYKKFLDFSFKIFGLGKFTFPGIAFATKNFHCAYYADGDDLEKILKFRNDSVESYFYQLKRNIKPVKRFFTQIYSFFIKQVILSYSEPYKAIRRKNSIEIKHYFG